MEIQNILTLIQAFTEHSLTELNVEEGGVKICLKKDGNNLREDGQAAGLGGTVAVTGNLSGGAAVMAEGTPTAALEGTVAGGQTEIPVAAAARGQGVVSPVTAGGQIENPAGVAGNVMAVSAVPAASVAPVVQTAAVASGGVSALNSGNVVVSPLVGIFYSAPSPEAESFVKVGDRVKKGQVLGIIEAMKLMNEIESEFDGVVEAILVGNEDVVEYGQPLFRIR